MAETQRDRHTPDIIPERIELRPALSSTGDAPVFLQDSPPAAPDPAPDASRASDSDAAATVSRSEEPAGGEPTEPAASPEPTPARPDARTVRAREAEARAERLERLLEQSIQALTAAQQPKQPEPAPPPPPAPAAPAVEPRPEISQFDDPAAFYEELGAWSARNATARMLAEHQSRQAEQAAVQKAAADKAAADKAAADQSQTISDTHLARRAKFIETHPDYVAVVERPNVEGEPPLFPERAPGAPALMAALLRAADGPELSYYLAQPANRADHDRILALSDPMQVVMEVGRISNKLAAPKPVEVSRTPAPITPVSGTGNSMATAPDIYDPNLSTDEYARLTGRDTPQYRPFLSSSGRPH